MSTMATIESMTYTDKSGSEKKYGESMIGKFRYLIYIVNYWAEKKMNYTNPLSGTLFEIDVDKVDTLEYALIPRSLSPRNEIDLIRVTEDPYGTGESFALYLMNATGCRLNEICGLNYSLVNGLRRYPNVHYIMVMQSTEVDSDSLKSSAKTWNACRKIPIPQKVFEAIEKRKQAVKKIIDDNGLICDVEQLPIINRGELRVENINRRCKSRKAFVDDVIKKA